MTTEVVTLDPQRLDKDVLQHAADILRRGGLVAFPTETVYGLGADATNPQAVARIFEAKGRPATNPTIVHIADVSAAKACAAKWPKEADEVANAFWPGPLTIIVPAAPGIAPAALAAGTTVGLRVPSHPVALALLKAAGKPIAAPSANRSESLSPTTAEHVLRTLDGRIDLILDGGPTTGGLESSVVDLSVAPPRLLRPGLISLEELRAVLPDLEVGASTDATIVSNSPGQLPRHYAPKTPLELVADMNERLNRSSHLSVGVVTFGGKRLSANFGRRLVERTLLNDPLAAAQSLYAVLHELDAMNLDLIVVELPPVGDDWSAIRDRLQRASTPAAPRD
jgi:L-threonylcarbamoyladenylate synthase